MKKLIYISVVLLAATSCLSRDFQEQEPYASIDTGVLIVPSDGEGGKVCDTLYITSNRNWSATFAEEVDWVKLGVKGNENLAGVSKISELPLEFDYNDSDESRSVELIISYGSKSEKVLLTQEAKINRLRLIKVTDGLESVSSDGGRFYISFYCNTEWKARLDYTDGMILNLSADSGSGSSKITVNVGANDDPDAGKKAVITLSAEGCRDIDVVLVQQRCTSAPDDRTNENVVY